MSNVPENIKLLLLKWKKGLLTEQEWAELEAWYAQSPPEELRWKKDSSESDLKERLLTSIRLQSSLDSPASIIRPHWKTWVTVAASILLVLGITFAYQAYQSDRKGQALEWVQVKQERGIQKIRLPDSSLVWLKGASELKYPAAFEGKTREVTLVGEALFEVTPDKQKPFFVKCGDYQARVVGTSFNVRSKANDFQLVVLTGTVQVSQKGDTHKKIITLTAKESFESKDPVQLVGEMKKAIPLERIEPLMVGTEYNMFFENTPFELMIQRFEEKFNVKMVGYTGEYKACNLTADLTDQSLEKSLNVICRTLNANYEINGNTFKIWGGGCF